MRKHLRCAAILLYCVTQFISFVGCGIINSTEDVPMVDVRIPDIRIPELTPAETAQFVERYGVSNDLTATGKTLEILSELDEWPDKMYEFVLLLPSELIPDEIYWKLAHDFLYNLNNDQMARFLELCYDTYEYTKSDGYVLLKTNTAKYEKIRYYMEQLIKSENYNDRDMLHKYCLFTAAKYISALVSKNPTGFQAFSIEDNADSIQTNYKEEDYTFVLNSLVINYISVNQDASPETPQHIRIYQTAMDNDQLLELYSFSLDAGWIQTEDALNTNNLDMVKELKVKSSYEGWFINMCVRFGYAYTKIVFSDESIGPIRMVFPKETTATVFHYGEEKNEQEGEGILIVAEPGPLE